MWVIYSKSKHNLLTILFYLKNSLSAYMQPDWDIFQFIVSFICGFGIIVYFAIPESPRWLIETGKRRRVEDLLIHAALVNGYEIKIPEDFGIENLDEYLEEEMKDIKSFSTFVFGLRAETTFAYGKSGLFHPDVRVCSLILFFLWTLMSFIYYGTSIGKFGLNSTYEITTYVQYDPNVKFLKNQ